MCRKVSGKVSWKIHGIIAVVINILKDDIIKHRTGLVLLCLMYMINMSVINFHNHLWYTYTTLETGQAWLLILKWSMMHDHFNSILCTCKTNWETTFIAVIWSTLESKGIPLNPINSIKNLYYMFHIASYCF